jgi:hypothetical protein
MKRRQALTALLSIPLGAFTFKDAQASAAHPAFLRIQLDNWSGVAVEHRGKTIVLSSADIFAALTQ